MHHSYSRVTHRMCTRQGNEKNGGMMEIIIDIDVNKAAWLKWQPLMKDIEKGELLWFGHVEIKGIGDNGVVKIMLSYDREGEVSEKLINSKVY